jgi:hypothetical protein
MEDAELDTDENILNFYMGFACCLKNFESAGSLMVDMGNWKCWYLSLERTLF